MEPWTRWQWCSSASHHVHQHPAPEVPIVWLQTLRSGWNPPINTSPESVQAGHAAVESNRSKGQGCHGGRAQQRSTATMPNRRGGRRGPSSPHLPRRGVSPAFGAGTESEAVLACFLPHALPRSPMVRWPPRHCRARTSSSASPIAPSSSRKKQVVHNVIYR